MSLTVGFSPATTPLPGTAKPNAGGLASGIEGAGDLFGALLALLLPGADTVEAKVQDAVTGLEAAVAPPSIAPPDLPAAPSIETPELAELAPLLQSADGKALLKELGSALLAAKQALDDGKPLDPALEKKLTEAVDAIAAWLAVQPPPAALPAAPLNAETGAAPAPATPASMEAKPVPDALVKLAASFEDIAERFKANSPELAKALASLAGRLAVGDVLDEALAQLGLARTTDSTTPELDGLVAALSAPAPKRSTADAPVFTTPTLELPQSAKPDPAPPQPAAPERRDEITLDAKVKLERDDKPAEKPAAEQRPTPPAPPTNKPDTPAPAARPAEAAVAPAQPVAANPNTAARAVHAAYAAPVQQLNLPQVAFEFVRQFDAGNSRFQIRLDPAELGRIDVRLDLDKHGTLNAKLFVERPETLDLMLRDQRALQQALGQAGLDPAKANLEFSLRQNPFAGGGTDTGRGSNGGQPGFGPGTAGTDESAELPAPTLYRGSATQSGLNLFV